MKYQRGFSLIEVCAAMVGGMILTVLLASLLTEYLRESFKAEAGFLKQMNFVMQTRAIEKELRSTVGFNPPHDILELNDRLYRGVYVLAEGEVPAQCRVARTATDAGAPVHLFNAVRFTRPVTNIKPLKTVRVWSELDSNQGTADASRALLIEKLSSGDPFAAGFPVEILLEDVSSSSKRHYVVRQVQAVTSNLDPSDGLPKTDAGGNPIVFEYYQMFVDRPSLISNGSVFSQALTLGFAKGSLLTAVETVTFCTDATAGKILRITERPAQVKTMVSFESDGDTLFQTVFGLHDSIPTLNAGETGWSQGRVDGVFVTAPSVAHAIRCPIALGFRMHTHNTRLDAGYVPRVYQPDYSATYEDGIFPPGFFTNQLPSMDVRVGYQSVSRARFIHFKTIPLINIMNTLPTSCRSIERLAQ